MRWLAFGFILLAAACGGGEGGQNLCGDDVVDPVDGDGCCTAGANANTDSDCTAECGNGIEEGGESCDDGNTEAGDGCDDRCIVEAEPTPFIVNEMTLADPHAFAVDAFDVTNTVNEQLSAAITTDGSSPPDGLLDFSLLLVFRPLDQAGGAATSLDLVFAECTPPFEATVCTRGDGAVVSATATNGDCLTPVADTTGGYMPAVTTPSAPCFATDTHDLDVQLGDINLQLADARLSATYTGDPATGVVQGLIAGFISETQADATILPEDILLVGGEPLSAILKDQDMDSGPDGEPGWWFYLNFTAQPVDYTD